MLFQTAKRVVVSVLGGTVVLVGIAMLVLPGPAVVVIPAGLAILATEFAWARWLLRRIKEQAKAIAAGFKGGETDRKAGAEGRTRQEEDD